MIEKGVMRDIKMATTQGESFTKIITEQGSGLAEWKAIIIDGFRWFSSVTESANARIVVSKMLLNLSLDEIQDDVIATFAEIEKRLEEFGEIDELESTSEPHAQPNDVGNIPASYRYEGNLTGEPLTVSLCKDRFGLSDAKLSRRGMDHRMKSGRGYVYEWSFVKKLADEK